MFNNNCIKKIQINLENQAKTTAQRANEEMYFIKMLTT